MDSDDEKYIEKTLSSKTVYEGRFFQLVNDKVELANGMIRPRDVVIHPGGAVVVAQKNDGKVLLVKQYRYPVKQVEFELPAGKLDKKDEDPFEAAQRELLEETGYIAKKWESLGFIYTTPGICTEKLYLYKASDLSFEKQQPDEGEIIDCYDFELDQIKKMIKNGTINDSKTICGIARAFCL